MSLRFGRRGGPWVSLVLVLVLAAMKARATTTEPSAVATSAAAGPGASVVRLAVAGACPTAAELEAQLRPLLPGWQLLAADSAADAHPEGASPAHHDVAWSPGAPEPGLPTLLIDGRAEEPPPLSADCVRRAEDLAVVIALVLAPPPPPPDPPPPRRAGPRNPALGLSLMAMGGVLLSAAPAGPARPGGGVELGLQPGLFGAVFGGFFAGSGEWSFASPTGTSDVAARLTSSVVYVGATLALERGPVAAVVALGPELEVLGVSGDGLDTAAGATTTNFGIRLGVEGSWWVTEQVALTLPLAATLWPSPVTFVAEEASTGSLSELGTSPAFVVRLAGGVRFRF